MRAYVVEVLEELKPEDVVTEVCPPSLLPPPLVQSLPSFLSTCWRAPLGVCGLGYGC